MEEAMKETNMASVNRVTLLGNLGHDPEMRKTTTGMPVVNVNLATSRRWKDGKGATQERTDWHRVVAFGRTAEVIGEYVKKGGQLYVEGHLQTRAYLDKDKNKRHVTEVIAERVQLLGRPQDQKVPKGGDIPEAAPEPPAPEGQVEDDIPF
jgi:single-strand DNA-binding protein